MGYEDARRDNIPKKKDHYGLDVYYPRCHICGHETAAWSYQPGKVYTCRACKAIHRIDRKLKPKESVSEAAIMASYLRGTQTRL